MKRFIIGILFAFLFVSLVGCNESDAVLKESKTYEITAEIHSLDIRINAADFSIRYAESFSVESNLKYLSVLEKGGVLTIVDATEKSNSYSAPVLTLYVPIDTVFEEVDITAGAAKIMAATLFADSLELKLGAGDVYFESLHVLSEAEIEGGAGKITVAGGTLNNLKLEMGMGELNLTSALQGSCDLDFGVGESVLTLIGGKDDYHIGIEKGIGNITIDGESVSVFENGGNSANRIEIEGGVGTIRLNFQEN